MGSARGCALFWSDYHCGRVTLRTGLCEHVWATKSSSSHAARRSLHALCRILLAVHCMLCRRAAPPPTRPFTCKAPISHPRMYVHTRNKHTIQHEPCDTKHAACNIRGDPSHSRRRSRAVRRSPPKIDAARCNTQRRRTMGSFVGTGSRLLGHEDNLQRTTCKTPVIQSCNMQNLRTKGYR